MSRLNEDYKYTFQYIDDDKIIIHEFNADITAERPADNIRDFLCACSWRESTVKEMFEEE